MKIGRWTVDAKTLNSMWSIQRREANTNIFNAMEGCGSVEAGGIFGLFGDTDASS